MDDFIGLEIYVLLAIAPCIASWLIGEMYGAWRTRRVIGLDRASRDTEAPLQFDVPAIEKSYLAANTAPIAELVSDGGGAACRISRSASRNPSVSQRRSSAARKAVARRAAAPPDLEGISKQASSIRQADRVWDNPDLWGQKDLQGLEPGSVLSHYARSVRALSADSGLAPRSADGEDQYIRVEMLPRLSECAPISSDLARTIPDADRSEPRERIWQRAV